jgi:hypothetical protein
LGRRRRRIDDRWPYPAHDRLSACTGREKCVHGLTHKLYRVGFTILTPLPGTYYFEQSKAQLKVLDWDQYDLHHLLWEPHLPVHRFFELYCETWKRTVLNAAGQKKSWEWVRDIDVRHIGHMARILARAQKLMDPQAYLAEFSVPKDLP